jgi:hypothetical protein
MDMVSLVRVRVEQPAKKAKKPKAPKARTAKTTDQDLFDQVQEQIPTDDGQPSNTSEIPVVASQPVNAEGHTQEEVPESVSERPARLQFREIRLLPENPFGDTSAECTRHFEEGHFYACVALTQAVLEALVHHIWQVHRDKRKPQEIDFSAILTALQRKGVFQNEWKSKLQQLWLNRHKFHHLRPSVEADQQTLVEMAKANLSLLDEMTQEFFGYDIECERVVPNHPEYWTIKEGEPQVL